MKIQRLNLRDSLWLDEPGLAARTEARELTAEDGWLMNIDAPDFIACSHEIYGSLVVPISNVVFFYPQQ